MLTPDPLGGSGGDLLGPRPQHEESLFDVTAMIDVVSLMNIYFLVTFVGAAMGQLELPSANHCQALDPDKATIFTVAHGSGEMIEVYLGDGKKGTKITAPEEQEERIADAVRIGIAAGKLDVLFKAEKIIHLRDMRRLARAASQESIALHFSVQEMDK